MTRAELVEAEARRIAREIIDRESKAANLIVINIEAAIVRLIEGEPSIRETAESRISVLESTNEESLRAIGLPTIVPEIVLDDAKS